VVTERSSRGSRTAWAPASGCAARPSTGCSPCADSPCSPAARREHSRTPEEFYDLVEATCAGGKLELFCRQRRDAWQVYGNDTAKFLEASGGA
jgi:hypothetical protein